MRVRLFWVVVVLTLSATAFVLAQGAGYKPGNAVSVVHELPPTCNVGEMAILTVTYGDTPMGTYFCTQSNVWQRMAYALQKNFTALQNNVFVDTVSIEIPNVSLSALVQVDVLGALGAGGAVGAFESSTARTVYIVVTRIAGADAALTMTAAINAADAHVPGGAGIVLGTQLGALSGAPSGAQTIQVQVRVVRGGGTSNNHSASIRALVLRAFGPGVTLT